MKELPARNRILTLIVFAQAIVIIAIVVSNVAIQEGPVSIASTILNTRPAFVFLFALVINRFFPQLLNERFTKGVIAIRFTAIVMIVAGVALLTL